jgi:hypothetical protein
MKRGSCGRAMTAIVTHAAIRIASPRIPRPPFLLTLRAQAIPGPIANRQSMKKSPASGRAFFASRLLWLPLEPFVIAPAFHTGELACNLLM